eukprot:scaffold7917_cov77-Skeletonema_marinoi.AAC.1
MTFGPRAEARQFKLTFVLFIFLFCEIISQIIVLRLLRADGVLSVFVGSSYLPLATASQFHCVSSSSKYVPSSSLGFGSSSPLPPGTGQHGRREKLEVLLAPATQMTKNGVPLIIPRTAI